MEATMKPSGSKVRSLRVRHGWTQENLAARSGVNAITISHVENGSRTARPSTVTKLAEALGVEPGELWDG